MKLATERQKIEVKDGIYYALPEQQSHVWRVRLDSASGLLTVSRKGDPKEYTLPESAFLEGDFFHRSLVDSFPMYIHSQAWLLHNYQFDQYLKRGNQQ